MLVKLLRSCAFLVSLCFTLSAVHAAEQDDFTLLDLSLDELLNVEVTSVSRKPQPLSETAAAVFVITAKDIYRSGALNIPEALRLAPGLQVTQIDATKWAVSARGFSGRYSDKLLVLVDGRTVYTNSFAGVYWEALNIAIDDIERIEVVRGPGGAVWGANAVNGVINIISKSAADTPGTLLIGGAGVDSSGDALGRVYARNGYSFGEDTHLRVFGKYDHGNSNRHDSGADTADDWDIARAGLRFDRRAGPAEAVVTAEIYSGDLGQCVQLTSNTPPYFVPTDDVVDVSGGHLLLRNTREFDSGASILARAYIDHTEYSSLLWQEEATVYDFDFQYRTLLGDRHDVQVGAGYRLYSYEYLSTQYISLQESRGNEGRITAYLQDDVSLFDEQVILTLGLKIEDYESLSDDLEILPTVRAVWKLDEDRSVWGAVTRSVRTPAYSDRGLSLQGIGPALGPGEGENPAPVPLWTGYFTEGQADSESLVAYELGYRHRVSDRMSFDIAAYYHDYKDLMDIVAETTTCEPSGDPVSVACFFPDPSATTHLLGQGLLSNASSATTSGLEVSHQWKVADALTLNTIYSYLDADGEARYTSEVSARFGDNARHKFGVRADWRINDAFDISIWPRYTSAMDQNNLDIDPFWDLDVRATWKLAAGLQLRLVGKQLLDSRQKEHESELRDIIPTEIERTVFAELRWNFE